MGYFYSDGLQLYPLKLGMPEGLRLIDLIVIGFVAAIGFTVSLFVATVAFEAGPVQDAAKTVSYTHLTLPTIYSV